MFRKLNLEQLEAIAASMTAYLQEQELGEASSMLADVPKAGSDETAREGK